MNHESNRTEGDVNQSQARQRFVRSHLDQAVRAGLDEDEKYFLHQSLSTPCFNLLRSAQGSILTDEQGREILDFHGNSVHQLGHAHPAVVAAIEAQLHQLAFCPRRFSNRPAIELARRLSDLSPVRRPSGPPRVLLAPAGALAIEMALKLARLTTGRYQTVSMWGSFHGASFGAVSVGGETQFRQGLEPLLPGCAHVPPYDPALSVAENAALVADALQQEGGVAAVVAEPMRWTTVVPPPKEYWQAIRQSCDAHGALLIIDEIPACLGRTGRLFCCEHFDLEPDILVIGKGLGGGVFPLAALIARSDLNVAATASIGHFTHEKSPLGAVSALAVLDTIAEQDLLTRAHDLGQRTAQRLQSLAAKFPTIREVRWLGLQFGVELQDGEGRTATEIAEHVLYDCLQRGLSFKVSAGNVLTLTPPLTITDAEMDRAVRILEQVFTAVG